MTKRHYLVVFIVLGLMVSALAKPVHAIPTTVEFTDDFGAVLNFRWASTGAATPAPTVLPGPVMTLPLFDPILGELLSANVFVSVHARSLLQTHCRFTGFCETEAQARFSETLILSNASFQLGVDLGPDLETGEFFSVGCSDTRVFELAQCIDGGFDSDILTRDLTFTGADVLGFIGPGEFSFNMPPPPIAFNGVHSGIPFDALLESTADDAGRPGEILALFNLALQIFNDDFVHGGFYSDAHSHATYQAHAEVTYTYEPPTGVPEPTSLALLGLGLAGLGFMRRRSAKH